METELEKIDVKTLKIALIEDDDAMRSLLCDYLGFLGMRVDCFEGGASFLASLSSGPCDYSIVVSDMHMPGLSGIQILRELRRRNLNCPFAMMSASPKIAEEKDCRELGVIGFLHKPFRLEELASLLAASIYSRAIWRGPPAA